MENKTDKRIYIQPTIEFIQLDNEISLALESNPMEGPDETNLLRKNEYFQTNPFEKSLV